MANAAIIHFPADHPTLQSAIDASVNGDTILVAPGHHYANVNLRSKRIVLASQYLFSGDPMDIWNTVLDGSSPTFADTGSVIIIAGLQDTSMVVTGFTITGGTGTKWRDISDNLVYREGGGILIEGASPRIKNNLIINNRSILRGPGVTSCGGGGMRVGFQSGARPVIEGNLFAFNQAHYGGALVSFHAPVIFRNNVVWRNSGGTDFGGAGLWIWNNGSLATTLVENNTIIANSTTNTGGGLSVSNSEIDIHNNIIRGNSGTPAQLWVSGAQSTTIWFNNIQGGYAGTGNIDEIPLFADSNFFLLPGSPGIDSGDPDPMYDDREDLGNPGNALWPALGSLLNDKGAYGGLGGAILPTYTSPYTNMITDSLDMGTVPTGSFSLPWILVGKDGYGPVRIDSIRFGHTSNVELYNLTSLPLTIPEKPYVDSIQILWNPSAVGNLLDTARIYHNDTTVANPLLTIVSGKVSCCEGTTGNVDLNGGVDLSDLSVLIYYMVITPRPELDCLSEANINTTGPIDLTDLSMLISYLLSPPGAVTLPPCP
ncbi:MAG: hypothetical protein IPH75_01605 [bacterium]|nr:hypothetical protein [bacterium]